MALPTFDLTGDFSSQAVLAQVRAINDEYDLLDGLKPELGVDNHYFVPVPATEEDKERLFLLTVTGDGTHMVSPLSGKNDVSRVIESAAHSGGSRFIFDANPRSIGEMVYRAERDGNLVSIMPDGSTVSGDKHSLEVRSEQAFYASQHDAWWQPKGFDF